MTTPETTVYLVLGCAAFAVIGGGYLLSLIARNRKLRKDLAAIKQILEEPSQ